MSVALGHGMCHSESQGLLFYLRHKVFPATRRRSLALTRPPRQPWRNSARPASIRTRRSSRCLEPRKVPAQRSLPSPRRRSVRSLWVRHYPRGFQGAGTRAGLLRVAIHGIRCIRSEARRQGTRRLPQNRQEARRKTRHARGRNWARRDRVEILQLGTRFRLCRRRVY